MTVCAPDLALRYFLLYASPGTSGARIRRDVRDFVAQVIELEHDDVGLAAVDAGVGREILDDAATIFGAGGCHIAQQPRLLRLPVPPVVLPPVRSEALATPRLQFRLAPSHWRKRFERLHFATFRARSHEGERAVGSLSLK
jgi:hypothetical protein